MINYLLLLCYCSLLLSPSPSFAKKVIVSSPGVKVSGKRQVSNSSKKQVSNSNRKPTVKQERFNVKAQEEYDREDQRNKDYAVKLSRQYADDNYDERIENKYKESIKQSKSVNTNKKDALQAALIKLGKEKNLKKKDLYEEAIIEKINSIESNRPEHSSDVDDYRNYVNYIENYNKDVVLNGDQVGKYESINYIDEDLVKAILSVDYVADRNYALSRDVPEEGIKKNEGKYSSKDADAAIPDLKKKVDYVRSSGTYGRIGGAAILYGGASVYHYFNPVTNDGSISDDKNLVAKLDYTYSPTGGGYVAVGRYLDYQLRAVNAVRFDAEIGYDRYISSVSKSEDQSIPDGFNQEFDNNAINLDYSGIPKILSSHAINGYLNVSTDFKYIGPGFPYITAGIGLIYNMMSDSLVDSGLVLPAIQIGTGYAFPISSKNAIYIGYKLSLLFPTKYNTRFGTGGGAAINDPYAEVYFDSSIMPTHKLEVSILI